MRARLITSLEFGNLPISETGDSNFRAPRTRGEPLANISAIVFFFSLSARRGNICEGICGE